jgi:vacuolar-type H+-ATPase subunit E/Vma4
MADGTIASFPTVVTGGVRAATDALVASRQNLEKAAVALVEERRKKVSDRIDAFLTATKNTASAADALKAHVDLEALRKSFEDQERAIAFWEDELGKRLAELAASAGPEVIAALNAQLAALRDQQAKEQGDVDKVALLIAEFEELIASIEKGGGTSTAKLGKGSPPEKSGGRVHGKSGLPSDN